MLVKERAARNPVFKILSSLREFSSYPKFWTWREKELFVSIRNAPDCSKIYLIVCRQTFEKVKTISWNALLLVRWGLYCWHFCQRSLGASSKARTPYRLFLADNCIFAKNNDNCRRFFETLLSLNLFVVTEHFSHRNVRIFNDHGLFFAQNVFPSTWFLWHNFLKYPIFPSGG